MLLKLHDVAVLNLAYVTACLLYHTSTMLIEIAGCSGSGKTTLLRRTAEKFQRSGLDVCCFPPEVLSAGGMAIRKDSIKNLIMDIKGIPWIPAVMTHDSHFLRFSWNTIQKNSGKLTGRSGSLNLLRSVIRKLQIYHLTMSERLRGKTFLVDEGIVQSAHNVLVHINRCSDDKEIQKFAELLPLPDAIVHVKAPLDVLIERTMKRKDPPIKGKPSDLQAFIRNGYHVFDKLSSIERIRRRSLIVCPVSSDGGQSELVIDRLVDLIAEAGNKIA